MDVSIKKYRPADIRLRRRDVLKFSLVVTGAILNPIPALAALDSKSRANKNLAFYNTHTKERLQVCYNRNGRYDPKALAKINYILRDHRSGEVKAIDSRLLELLHELSLKTSPQAPFHVISGYRSPNTNKKLRKKSNSVASRSLHMQGKAIDIRMPGFKTRQLRKVARQLKLGGVGYYAKSDFVHVDIGRVRYW
ncbi:FIG001587: exported protein [Olavius algarvensis Delta 1 endosymbiont]|nr:FIG001587: exported protein [Olavius algarvensis Delta 1 endosymbiont]